MSVRETIDLATAKAKEFAAEAFMSTAHIGPGGFEGYMAAALYTYEKQLRLMEALFKHVSKNTDQEIDPQVMVDLVALRTWVQVLKHEAERLS